MAKPRIQIGTFGTITFITRPSGHVEARARYRDWDGKAPIVQATAGSKPAAERALKAKLSERLLVQPSFTTLSADSKFRA